MPLGLGFLNELALNARFTELMTDTFILEKAIGSADPYNPFLYGPQIEWQGRLEQKVTMIRTTDGRELVSRGRIIFNGLTGMTLNDRITLPDGSNPIVLSLVTTEGPLGPIYDTAYLE